MATSAPAPQDTVGAIGGAGVTTAPPPGGGHAATATTPATTTPATTTPATTTPATTTPATATTTPATAATTPAPTVTATKTTTTTPLFTPTQPAQASGAHPASGPRAHSSSKLSTPALIAAVLAALLALGCAVWGIARMSAYEPRWTLSLRHAMAEAGFRASATWAEFTDWARLGH